MVAFTLTNDQGTELTFDMEGQVLDAEEQIVGSWSCNADNAVVCQRSAEEHEAQPEPEVFPAHWRFNELNQLCLCDADGEEHFNFNTSLDFPEYELRHARLRVRPLGDPKFEFFLSGDWHLNADHLLEFTIGAHRSLIDGVFSDGKSRLSYHFLDKDQTWISNRLTFTGRWELENADGEPASRFFYSTPEGEEVFELPGKVTIERGSNQFMYTYDKESRSFGITLQGFLKVSENFEISYSLDKQESQDGDELVAQTAFTLQAAFFGNQFQGDLSLSLLKDDGKPGDYLLSLTGNYVGVIGETQVMAGFRFSQRRHGRMVTTTFGFGGSIVWKNGQFFYEFTAGGGEVALSLGADIRLGEAVDVNARTTIVGENGQLKRVTFMLGVKF